MKKIILYFYNAFLLLLKTLCKIYNKILAKFTKAPYVMEIEETIDKIVKNKLSVSRFGDGEIKLISKKNISFQTQSEELSEKLKKALSTKDEKFLPCIPGFFKSVEMLTESGAKHWSEHFAMFRHIWHKNTRKDIVYGNAFLSRFYLGYVDKSKAPILFQKIKEIWDGRNIVFVEGNQSRMGVGNDLFSNANSVKRILVPSENAYDKYDEIIEATKANASLDDLILLAVGPTATVLAWDLFQLGYQAIDLGHLDIQYEWFLAGATHKQPVRNKIVNEARTANEASYHLDENDEYYKQIVAEIK